MNFRARGWGENYERKTTINHGPGMNSCQYGVVLGRKEKQRQRSNQVP